MTMREKLRLTFAPGFPTKEEVSEISGRGVGMDAVAAAVQELNGTVEISTQAEQSTTFSIAVPLN